MTESPPFEGTLPAHPFAAAGGGHLFEYKVATLCAANLILSRHTALGGVVAAIEMQTGPAGFEDLQISVERIGGGSLTVHVQCRYQQPFAKSNGKFVKLLAQAASAVSGDAASFIVGDKRLAIIVDDKSPGHASMTQLCELARDPGSFERFESVVGTHGNRVGNRWSHCLQAAGDLEPESLHRVLASIELLTVDLRSEKSRDSVELINRLADAWTPKNLVRATRLRDALFRLLTDTGPTSGMIDLSALQSHLSTDLPSTLGAETRRAKLGRRRDGVHHRVAATMKAIGLNDDEANELATRVLADPPSVTPSEELTVVTGGMGVGKTTELERIHRAAIDRALQDPNAPIPVSFDAGEIADSSLSTVVSQRCEGLGDPSRVGVHLIIDALDEAGVRIADISRDIATLQAEWPNSTVLVGTRPQCEPSGLKPSGWEPQRSEPPGSKPSGTTTAKIEPLTSEAAQSLMTAIHPGIPKSNWLREELSEVIRRPMFAIRFALNQRQGNRLGTRGGQLVASVGLQAVKDIDDATDRGFELLVRLACLVADSGGRPVSLSSLGATPHDISILMRSRIIQTTGGHVSFQLAALTEWFAATALLNDQSRLDRSVSDAVQARRWRYVFVQALLQGSADQVDQIMLTLLEHVPATAAWVHYQVQASDHEDRSTPLAVNAQEAGTRIRRAAKAWIEPWPHLAEQLTEDGELPTLGVALNEQNLTTAWRSDGDDSRERVVQLPPDFHPSTIAYGSWNRISIGMPMSSETWPWKWTRDEFQTRLDLCIKNSELLADIKLCWTELAWSYAHQILDLHPGSRSEPVLRSDLEAMIAEYRSLYGDREVCISRQHGRSHGRTWSLKDGEEFVADLAKLGMNKIEQPWPLGKALTTAMSKWTSEHLFTYLPYFQSVTKTALDIYQEIVTRHLPSMAHELNTYQLLPGSIVGLVEPVDPERGFLRPLVFRWHIEPLPVSSQNESQWGIRESNDFYHDEERGSQMAKVQALRGDLTECINLGTCFGVGHSFFSSTPACSFALELLHKDLCEFEWLSDPIPHSLSGCYARPRYT